MAGVDPAADATAAALLREVLANPDDDGLRLVYADYLTAHGDPRGEFIVVQCGLARERSPRLVKREQQLLSKFKRRWFDWLDDFGAEYVIDRGFVKQLRAFATPLCTRGAELFDREPVQCVRVTGGFRELGHSPILARIPRVLVEGFVQDDAFDRVRAFVVSPGLARVRNLELSLWYDRRRNTAPLRDDLFDAAAWSVLETLTIAGPAGVYASLARAQAPCLRELVLDPQAKLHDDTLSAIRTAFPTARVRVVARRRDR